MNEDHLVILRVDSSMRQVGSVSRDLADEAISTLQAGLPDAQIVLRDLKAGVGHVNSAWREASLKQRDLVHLKTCNFSSVRCSSSGS